MARPALGNEGGANGAVVALDAVSGDDDFAQRLSLALRAANLSGAQLSAAVGVDKSVVSRWLSGHVQPTSYNLARISAAIARVNPGFNMLLWTAPRAQFEAALGLSRAAEPSVSAPSSALPPAATSHVHRRRWQYGAIATAMLLAFAGWFAWNIREPFKQERAPVVAASVAVMPFVNMSGDPTKEYVASRTSAFSFKGKTAYIGEIARKLHVKAVLEGSVRQEGNSLRIVAQLIDAKSGYHLWSARYDRRLDDILVVQDEIARAIAVALSRKLTSARSVGQVSQSSCLHRVPSRALLH